MPASEADVLTALAETGGLPGEGVTEILIYRRRTNTAMSNQKRPAKPQRIRDKAHLRQVARLPCVICDRRPAQAQPATDPV